MKFDWTWRYFVPTVLCSAIHRSVCLHQIAMILPVRVGDVLAREARPDSSPDRIVTVCVMKNS